MKRMEDMELHMVEGLLFILHDEQNQRLAYTLNDPLFGRSKAVFVEGVELANSATCDKAIMVPADMTLTS